MTRREKFTTLSKEFVTWFEAPAQMELRKSCAAGWAIYIWQASRESLVVELPSSGTVVGKAYVAHCRQAIEAAGIKVKP
jgi:hypothetical protein